MRTTRRHRPSAVLTATLLFGAVVTGIAPSASASAPDIECDTHVSSGLAGLGDGLTGVRGESDDYEGPKASDRYDALFTRSHAVPHLRTHVPQGLATWTDWQGEDGEGDLLLVSSYLPARDPVHRNPEEHTYISALDATTGRHVGTVQVESFHGGGIAVLEEPGPGWAYLPNGDAGGGKVSKFRLTALRTAIVESTPDRPVPLAPEGPDQVVSATSFLAGEGATTLWAGSFVDDGRGSMRSYEVAASGEITERRGSVQVPPKTQGLVVTREHFLYSTSHGRTNRSNIWVVGRGAGTTDLDRARLSCFRAPSMSEGMTAHRGKVYVSYESGASFYHQEDVTPDNPIADLHTAPLSELEGLVR